MPSLEIGCRATNRFTSMLLCVALLVFCSLINSGSSVVAAEVPVQERRTFEAARVALDDGLYEFAEKKFAEFLTLYPASPVIQEARLYLSQARFYLKNYAESLELLERFIGEAGPIADQYQFWIAESLYAKGDAEKAGEAFGKLIATYPDSDLLLTAALRQAHIRYQLKDYAGAVELLAPKSGAFQTARSGQPDAPNSVLGLLMLADAQFALEEFESAENTLSKLPTSGLKVEQGWKRANLLVRVFLATDRLSDAEKLLPTLMSLANERGKPFVIAEANSLKATVLERQGDLKAAIAALKPNLEATAPKNWRRDALVKTVEMSLVAGSADDAVAQLELLSVEQLDGPARDLVQLTLGELRLKQFYALPFDQRIPGGSYSSAASNALALAQIHFDYVITNYTNSSYLGKAWNNRAWCDWQLQQWPSAEVSFSNAVIRLPRGMDHAVSIFKLGDSQFMLESFTKALANYNDVIALYGESEIVKNQLLDQVYYQIIQAGIAANDMGAAVPAMQALIGQFPGSFYADRSLLLVGQALNDVRDPSAARDVFEGFRSRFTGSSLEQEVQLAIARTYELEGNWDAAAKVYAGWLTNNTQHASIPNATFGYAWAQFQAGQLASAHSGFTNFVTQFPADELAPIALQWLGDEYYSNNDYANAELYYQKLFMSTNWPASPLTFNAQMLAGRAALGRQDFSEAKRYLTNLINHPNCPEDVYTGALFAYGDVLMSEPSESGTKFTNARGAFDQIVSFRSDSREVPAALGRIGDCDFQLKLYEDATNAYQKCLTHPLATISERSQAEVKLGKTLEMMAQTNAETRDAILAAAMVHYLNVFYQTNLSSEERETPDIYWIQRAGLDAAALAEFEGDFQQAANLYRTLKEMMPQLSAYLDQRIQQQERSVRQGGG